MTVEQSGVVDLIGVENATGKVVLSIVDHLEIVEALERRDTEAAEYLTRQHTLNLAAHVESHCEFPC